MEQPTTTYRIPGAILTEREHTVPLDHAEPDWPDDHRLHARGGRARTARTDRISCSCRAARASRRAPDQPADRLDEAGDPDYRVLLLDQRGTGRSTPVGAVIPGDTPEAQAEYLTHFRADSIVRDAEHIRHELGVERWSVLGQSFGGFTSMTYLSFAPEGLREAFITGGLSPIGRPVDDIYGATYRRRHRGANGATSSATPTIGPGPRHPAPAR